MSDNQSNEKALPDGILSGWMQCEPVLEAEIIRRYNNFKSVEFDLQQAQSALTAAGFTRCDNGAWKPPLGKPIGPVLESLDAERETVDKLAGQILDMAGAALPHMPTDEHLRYHGIKAVNAALAVMEGRKP